MLLALLATSASVSYSLLSASRTELSPGSSALLPSSQSLWVHLSRLLNSFKCDGSLWEEISSFELISTSSVPMTMNSFSLLTLVLLYMAD